MTGSSSRALLNCPGQRVKVLLPLPLGQAYDYRLPGGMEVRLGDFVAVPLGKRVEIGVIWGCGDRGGVAEEKLRDVEAVLDVPPLPQANMEFIEWVSSYTLAAPGAVLRMAMSSAGAFEPPPPRIGYVAGAVPAGLKITSARKRVLDIVADGPARPASDIAREAGVSSGVVKGLSDAGALVAVPLPSEGVWRNPDPDIPGPELSAEQAKAAYILSERVAARSFSVSVLDGVTGSGKTEVYFEAVATALKEGRQALVLLPEISLSAQWLHRFEARFGVEPAVWHSDLTQAQRRNTWRAVAEGKARIVVGARSALHLPMPDLGLIVIDEEHDQSFKQEDGVIYHARDMAVVRARLADCPIALVSATPSLETDVNIRSGRYHRLHLPERHGIAELPEIVIVDTRKDKPARQNWITPPLLTAVEETLKAGEQALLFLNRRGYAPLTLCRDCGFRFSCPNCTAWLVEHRFTRRLECHHCGYAARIPERCPDCGGEDSFAACGPGVERIAEEVANNFPEARVALATSDTFRGPASAAEFVEQVQSGAVNLIVGTQIVAKGYHFPMLTLVGVIDADLGLAGGDLRAAERTYQLLHQVSGRAGRAGLPGRVMIQTANPDARVMDALARGDRDGFLAAEAEDRRNGGWPPFGRLAAIIVSGPDEDAVEGYCRALAAKTPRVEGAVILGPATPPMALLRGRFRRRFLIRTARDINIQKLLRDWLSVVRAPNALRIAVDIDPYSFL